MKNPDIYQKAKKRATAKYGFYIHLGVYLSVMILLLIINTTATGGYFWVKWPFLGWGIGVFWHAMSVFVLYGKSSVPEKMIQKELDKEMDEGLVH